MGNSKYKRELNVRRNYILWGRFGSKLEISDILLLRLSNDESFRKLFFTFGLSISFAYERKLWSMYSIVYAVCIFTSNTNKVVVNIKNIFTIKIANKVSFKNSLHYYKCNSLSLNLIQFGKLLSTVLLISK